MSAARAPARSAGAGRVDGLLFDKDGTLFGFQATWGGWAADLLRGLVPGDPDRQADLAERLGLDLATRSFRAHSPIIAGTMDDSIAAMLPALPGWTVDTLRARLFAESLSVRPVEAVPLRSLLARLSTAGLSLGIATNDSEAATRAQLVGIGLEDAFDFIAGADSGYGAKPDPGPCAAFAAAQGLAPDRVAMVGDTMHDLRAGRACGMQCVAVLTGVAVAAELAPAADIVLPDIGHLPEWLGLRA